MRYWGINFGLPHTEARPDETTIVRIAFHFFSGDLNPHYFNYPTLYMYILFLLFIAYFLFGVITGRFTSLSDLLSEYSINPTNFYLLSRFLSASLGIATIFLVYKIVKQTFNKKTALIASSYLSLTYLHVRDSHFGTTDVPATFLIIISLLFIIKTIGDGKLKNYLITGILIGLATAMKYFGIILILPLLFVHLFNLLDKKGKTNRLQQFFNNRILFFAITLFFGFFVGSPFALLDFSQFQSHLLQEMTHLNVGHYGLILGRGWWYHLRFSLFYGLGWALFFLTLAGIPILLMKNMRMGIILLSFPLFYYLLMGKGYTVFVRYTIPLLPFLCITAAVFITLINNQISKFLSSRLANLLTIPIVILTITPSFDNIIKFNRLIAKRDSRLLAGEWINKNIPPGTSIYQSGMLFGQIQLHPELETLEENYKELVASGNHFAAKILKARIEYIKQENIPGYEEWRLDYKSGKFVSNNKKQEGLPKYIVISMSPLELYSRIPIGLIEILTRDYSLKQSWEVIDLSCQENKFDQHDAFYLPFTGFKNIERPGPNIYIYERNKLALSTK